MDRSLRAKPLDLAFLDGLDLGSREAEDAIATALAVAVNSAYLGDSPTPFAATARYCEAPSRNHRTGEAEVALRYKPTRLSLKMKYRVLRAGVRSALYARGFEIRTRYVEPREGGRYAVWTVSRTDEPIVEALRMALGQA